MAPKLAPNGIFVTQSGPAGVLTCSEVFAPINHTLRSVFPRVVPYVQHVPSYVDTWVRNPGHFKNPTHLLLPAVKHALRSVSSALAMDT